MNSLLKYRTFDNLFEDVKMELPSATSENFITPAPLIKVARKINFNLGLRINQDYEDVLEIKNGKAKLPNNFYTMNYAFLCGDYEYQEVLPQGTNMQDTPIPEYTPYPEDPVMCETPEPECAPEPEPTCNPKVYTNSCGQDYQVVQHINTRTRVYRTFMPIRFQNSTRINPNCINTKLPSPTLNNARIEAGWVYTNLEEGQLYIQYTGSMENLDGELIVPDHELINEYYEYALKEKIYEQMIYEGENVSNEYQLIQVKLREAKNAAISLVKTPNFEELRKMHEVNRRAQYGKYYYMFTNHSPQGSRKYY